MTVRLHHGLIQVYTNVRRVCTVGALVFVQIVTTVMNSAKVIMLVNRTEHAMKANVTPLTTILAYHAPITIFVNEVIAKMYHVPITMIVQSTQRGANQTACACTALQNAT